LLASFGFEEELGELGGSELKADFGELAGVIFAEVFEEVVLEEASFEGAVLFDAPVAIAAAGFPVGDVAFGDSDAVFFESADNLGVRDVIAEHAVDHVEFGVREAGDFAVAGATLGFGGREDLKLRGIAVRRLFGLELSFHDAWGVLRESFLVTVSYRGLP